VTKELKQVEEPEGSTARQGELLQKTGNHRNRQAFDDGTTQVLINSDGPAYGPYRVLTTTNLALLVASWSVLTTNYFDASGQINPPFNTPVNPGQAQQFFMLSGALGDPG